jgi:hypothetical protein
MLRGLHCILAIPVHTAGGKNAGDEDVLVWSVWTSAWNLVRFCNVETLSRGGLTIVAAGNARIRAPNPWSRSDIVCLSFACFKNFRERQR